MNLNKVFILGRLTADPQLRATSSGSQVATFSLATNRVWTDKAGARREETEFHNVVVWGRQAEIVSQFLKKGALALIEGRLQTRSWQGNDGVKRKTTEIIGERVQLGPRSAAPAAKNFEAKNFEADKAPEEVPTIEIEEGEIKEEIKEEDLPF